jgi:hypothetical protein
MINSSLSAFTAALIQAGHIRSGDVRRLQRDILPDGVSSRAEAELLLRLDQSVSRANPAFSAWLVTVMVDFVVWDARPTGYVDRETTEWLVSVLGGSWGPTRTALLITSEIVREAQNIDEALLSWMRTNSREAPRKGFEMMSLGRSQRTPSSSRAPSLWRTLWGRQRRSRRGSHSQARKSSLARSA